MRRYLCLPTLVGIMFLTAIVAMGATPLMEGGKHDLGTGSGTTTFSGPNERGILSDLGVAYLDSGDVVSYKGQGVYWSTSQGNWETREAVVMGDQMLVVEGQITLSDGVFSINGTVSPLT